MRIQLQVALTHLTGRKRQSLVSLTGVILGVAFFLAVSSLMRGSEKDFIKRLIDNSPHITVYDEYRSPRTQPAELRWPGGAVHVSNVKPQTETRGIRGYREKLEFVEAMPGVKVAPVLVGSAVLVFAGRQESVTLSGVVPAKMKTVSTLEEKMVEGSIDALAANPNGIVIGVGLARKFNLTLGRNVNVVAANGVSRPMKVVGIFRTGNADYDEKQTFTLLKRAQVMFDRPNRVNRLIIQLDDPYAAREAAQRIEAFAGYKAVSWVEASEDILSVLVVRNIIMYSVVSAILVVASFGIYNTLSTIVMEKTRDIAILKSIGFHARDVRLIFLFEGAIIGVVGSTFGLLLGAGLMKVLEAIEFRPPGVTEKVQMPIWWGPDQFALAAAFALVSCMLAAYLPARRAGRVHPVEILRGAA
ncbi:ABC transporter permease [Methylocaldum szegediense]|uniref:Lipoprotein-releasing system permease protein n=1 Tax=Methylocaldum szegediense TaxID=73780 RepID=A0ABM9I2B9_9GAMM|nr:ABC transporter permease [Methylocaldum szegediense]CAI8844241.1 lipoprotein-releasing system permease protein [Methylocaldum szegediense]